jgi:hypothetical protein
VWFQVLLEPHDVTARHLGSVIVAEEFGKSLEMRFGSASCPWIINPFFPCPFRDQLGEGGLTGIIAYPVSLERRHERL